MKIENLSPPAIHGEAIAGQSTSIRKQLMLAVEDLKERTFDLAELLYTAKSQGFFRQWGYGSITEYGEVELGLKPSKTQYLVRIVEVMAEVGIERKEYEPVGVTKLREIKRLDPKGEYFNGESLESLSDHIKRLVTEASSLTTSKISLEVDRLLGMTDGNRIVLRTLSFTENGWSNVVEKAVELVRKEMGSKGRDSSGMAEDYPAGKCIEMICADFLADPNNDVPIEIAVEPSDAITSGDIPLEEPTI